MRSFHSSQDDERSREPLIGKRNKAMSAIEGRGLVLVIVGLLFASALTSMPTLFYFWDPTAESRNQHVSLISRVTDRSIRRN